MDLKKIMYAEATTREIAIMTSAAMKKSKNLTKIIYKMNLTNCIKPRLNGKELVRDFYETSNCYDEFGNVTKEGKKNLEKALESIGLTKESTLLNVMHELVKKYK